jgi:Nucleotide modification associated domain 3
MKVALLRVGIDSGCGGMQGPLFRDGSFEFIPIPDDRMLDSRTYGNTLGRSGRPFAEFFSGRRRQRMAKQPMHVDPEFETFTYGDPTPPKQGLRHLDKGDLLIFYAGLQGSDFISAPALYIIGYFEVQVAGLATLFSPTQISQEFAQNFHVRHRALFEQQKEQLVLVKGGKGSRLLNKAHLLSETVTAKDKPPLKKITASMRRIFGEFGGRHSFQRSPTRWVEPDFVERAARFVRSLS